VVVIASNSAINTVITKPNQEIDRNGSNTYITNLARDSSILLMLGQALVLSAEHFSHLKVPVCEQEVAIVIKCIVQG
jgi:hypothetical protein